MTKKYRNQSGFFDFKGIFILATLLIIILIGYNLVSGHQKVAKISASLDSLIIPTGLQLKNKECSGGSIDTQAMCNYIYSGSVTFESSKQIADQLIAKGYTVLDKHEDVSYIRLWQLRGDGNIVSISVFSGNILEVNSEAGASKN